MVPKAAEVRLKRGDRAVLEARVRASTSEQRDVMRARSLLMHPDARIPGCLALFLFCQRSASNSLHRDVVAEGALYARAILDVNGGILRGWWGRGDDRDEAEPRSRASALYGVLYGVQSM